MRGIHGGLGPQRIEGKTMRWLHHGTRSPCPLKLVESESGLPVDLNEHGITTSRSNVLASRHRPFTEADGRRLLDRRPPRPLDSFEPALPTDANVQASIVVQTDGWRLLVWNGWCRAFVGLGIWTVYSRVSQNQALPRRSNRGSGTPASANPLARRMQLSHNPHGVSLPS